MYLLCSRICASNQPLVVDQYYYVVSLYNSLIVTCFGLVHLCIDIVLIFFHILVLQECWVLMESRIPLVSAIGRENCCTFH